MKKIIFVFLSLFIVEGAVVAQKPDNRKDSSRFEKYFFMRDGKLYQVNKAVETQLKMQVKLKNGTVINPDGTFQISQQTYQLKVGEYLDMNSFFYFNWINFYKGLPGPLPKPISN